MITAPAPPHVHNRNRLLTLILSSVGEERKESRVLVRERRFTHLSDPPLQKDLDIAEDTDPDHNPMILHVIVLEPGLVIYKIYMGYWFFGRPTINQTSISGGLFGLKDRAKAL
jgi:hypothetical protein